jgi:hypothetical protein
MELSLAYLPGMEFEFPLYALRRSDSGRWVVWAPADDPRLPAVIAVAAFDEVWRPRMMAWLSSTP